MKKLNTIFILLLLLLNIVSPIFETLASGITTTTFTLNNSGNATINLKPGDRIQVYLVGRNDSGISMTDVNGIINFDYNQDISYGGDIVGGVNEENTIPTNEYTITDGLRALITRGTDSILASGGQPYLYSYPSSNSFTIEETASNYENNVRGYFEGEGGMYTSSPIIKTVYVDVKPHIVDYYFEKGDGSTTTSQVQGSEAEPINLVLKIKDYNGCNNISGGEAYANLSQLGLGLSENLTYVSCDSGSKTATFKKTGITTGVGNGTYSFQANDFTFIDSDSNENDENDTRFGSIDKKTTLSLTVVSADAPNVSLINIEDDYIGGPTNLTSEISFSGSQTGETRISLGSDGSCEGGTILEDWTVYTANATKTYTVNSSDLIEGDNNIYACIKNSGGNIGSINLNIKKDVTQPVTGNPIMSPGSITTQDSSIEFTCSENGEYEVRLGGSGNFDGTFVGSGSATASSSYKTTLPNTLFTTNNTSYTIYGYCKDNAGNTSYKTGVVNKIEPTPTMGNITSFGDNDIDNNGLDGRDLTVSWDNTSAVGYSNFESYRLYLLPSNISFNSSTQSYIKLLIDKSLSTWTGDSSITKDSLGDNLISGGSYKLCIAILGNSGELGTSSCSSASTITSDVVQNPKVLSAKFTSDTNLELTTDATLDTDLGNHDASKITFTYNSSTKTASSVSSVNGTKINLTITSLGNIGATGTNIIMLTGALHSAGGGYNNYFSSGGLTINDAQAPTITGFSNITVSPYNSFYNGNINVGFTFAEQMKASGNTKIVFDRTSGNASTQKSFAITDPTKLTSGAKTQTLSLSGLLVSGTTYDMKLIGQDLAGNQTTSSPIVVKFDNVGPSKPTIIDAPNTSSSTPTLSWNSSTDDSGNGSGVKEYSLKVYSGNSCSGGAIQTHTVIGTSKQVNTLSNGTYSFNVQPTDNVGNVGTLSNCDSFLVDTNIATISNLKITDTTINSTSFAKTGDSVTISADLTNTDITKITADLRALTGNASHTGVLCSSPVSGISCSYNAGVVNYTFNVGFGGSVTQAVRQITLYVSNVGETQNTSKIASITIDNTNPTSGTISSPTGTIGGNSNNITWSGISDSNLNYLKFEYSTNGGAAYNLIATGANASPYTWNTTSLTSGSNYKVRITALDRAGNESITESSIFSVDKDAPIIGAGVITAPASGAYVKGNSTYNITWNTGNISDAGGLKTNPISFSYSTNSGSTWNSIVSDISNNGTYSWTVPSLNSSNISLRMTVTDNVGNTSIYITSYKFTIDTTNPTFSIGVSTPANGSYINSGGFDLEGIASDTNLKSISYSFKRVSDNKYWNGSSYTGVTTWNILQDNLATISYNTNTLINPNVSNGETYDLVIRSRDYAGNEILTTARRYTGDTSNPNVVITNSSGSYFKDIITISGTSNDLGSGISSVKISIKKGSQYWDGTSWVGTSTQLSTSTSNSYANWNYTFTPISGDNDGQSYEIIAYAYDSSYKVNNSSSSSINIILDKVSPTIGATVFTFDTALIYGGGDVLSITWNNGNITDSGSSLTSNPISLEYFNGSTWIEIANNLANNGSYDFTLPSLDIANARIRISATDNVGNTSSQNSNTFKIDSTPPSITSIETMDTDTDGQIDALKVILNESIKDSSIVLGDFTIGSSIGTPTSWTTGLASNDNKFILHFADYGDTSSVPNLTYVEGSLADLAGKKLASISNVASTDKTSPRVLSAQVFDEDSNGKLDKVEVTFSENISSTTNNTAFSIAGKNILSVSTTSNIASLTLEEGSDYNTSGAGLQLDFVSNSNWKDSSNNEAGSLGSLLSIEDKAKPILISGILKDTNSDFVGDKIILSFSENITGTLGGFTLNNGTIGTITASGTTDLVLGVSGITGTNPSITLDYAGNLADSNSNTLDNISTFSVNEKISPKLLGVTTLDQDNDGKIDGVNLNFSENITGTFSDFTVGVNSYGLASSSIYSFSGTTDVLVNLEEKQIFDTNATPLVSVTTNTTIKDNNNNTLLGNQSVISSDGVGPVITGARFDEGTRNLYLNFSENVSNTLNNASFTLNNSTASISSTTFTPGSSSAILNLSNTGITYGTSEISFASNTANDSHGNSQSSAYFTKISASVLINEYMSDGDVKYIELKNISSSSVDIGGWTIVDALAGGDLTLSSYSIPAGGYYLISTNNTYFSGVTANQIATLDITSDLTLKNGTITVDSMLYQAGTSNISYERLDTCSNSLSASCWYEGVSSNGFVNSTYKGTPGNDNIFDSVSPTVLTTTPTTDTLYPNISNIKANFTYEDDVSGVGIDTNSISLNIEKFDGSVWNKAGSITINTGSISASASSFDLSGFDYGRYRLNFSVSDLAGNETTQSVIFYVDNFSFSLDTSNVDLGTLTAGSQKLSNDIVTLTVKTIGASFNLTHTVSNPSNFGNWDSSKGFGACLGISCTTLENFNSKVVANEPKDLQTSGNLKTYTYQIRYGALVNTLQEAGVYNFVNSNEVLINY